jgi:hypothetical protein
MRSAHSRGGFGLRLRALPGAAGPGCRSAWPAPRARPSRRAGLSAHPAGVGRRGPSSPLPCLLATAGGAGRRWRGTARSTSHSSSAASASGGLVQRRQQQAVQMAPGPAAAARPGGQLLLTMASAQMLNSRRSTADQALAGRGSAADGAARCAAPGARPARPARQRQVVERRAVVQGVAVGGDQRRGGVVQRRGGAPTAPARRWTAQIPPGAGSPACRGGAVRPCQARPFRRN